MAKEHVTKCSKDNHVVHDEKAWYLLGMSLCPEYLLCYIRIAGHVKYCSGKTFCHKMAYYVHVHTLVHVCGIPCTIFTLARALVLR